MKNKIAILFSLGLIKLIIQMIGNRNYGFHRDELLHLSVSEHLDWGFMEFPPFIGLIGKCSQLFFDYSLLGTRLFPTLAGVGILMLCGLMAKEMKGNNFAIFLAGISVLAFLPFYRNHTLFQPVAFDQFFWTLGFYFLIRFLNTENNKFLLLTGLTFGVGLTNKYTIIIWAFGVFMGMIFYQKGKVFKNKWWYLSGVLALLIIFPNIFWQVQNNFPLLRHLRELNESQLSQLNVFEFGLEQLNYPVTLLVSIVGTTWLFNKPKFRPLGIAAIIIFFTMWMLQSKAYYVFALYPVLFAAGSIKIANWLQPKNSLLKYGVVLILMLPTVFYIPHATPILSIEAYEQFADLKEKNGRIELTGDYADMFGWEEQVQLVDSIYQSFSSLEKKNTVIWAENYGEAGALKILGRKYGLPNPICRHGSFWKWGYGNDAATTWISLGNEAGAVNYIFEETKLIKMIKHKYAIGEENEIPVYICKKPKMNIPKWWKDFEPYIFD